MTFQSVQTPGQSPRGSWAGSSPGGGLRGAGVPGGPPEESEARFQRNADGAAGSRQDSVVGGAGRVSGRREDAEPEGGPTTGRGWSQLGHRT